jgi:hypothetical protein
MGRVRNGSAFDAYSAIKVLFQNNRYLQHIGTFEPLQKVVIFVSYLDNFPFKNLPFLTKW